MLDHYWRTFTRTFESRDSRRDFNDLGRRDRDSRFKILWSARARERRCWSRKGRDEIRESQLCSRRSRPRHASLGLVHISIFLIVHIDIIRRGINPDNVTGKVINNSVSVVFIFYHKFPTNSCPKSAFFNICYLLMKSILFFRIKIQVSMKKLRLMGLI